MIILLLILLAAILAAELWSLKEGADPLEGEARISARSAEPGEAFPVKALLMNSSPFPASHVRLDLRLPRGAEALCEGEKSEILGQTVVPVTFRMKGRSSRSGLIYASLTKRGVFDLSAGLLRRGDFLGLREAVKDLPVEGSIMIFPKRWESEAMEAALGSYCGELQSERWLIRDPILTMGLRDYTGMEPMKAISWSQSARRDELTVREFDYTREISCAVLLNTFGAWLREGDADLCCSMARTVCEELSDAGISVEFFTNAALTGLNYEGYWSVSAGKDRLEEIWEVLARVEPSYYTVGQLAADVCEKLEAAGGFIMITPRYDRETAEAVSAVEARFGIRSLVLSAEEEMPCRNS